MSIEILITDVLIQISSYIKGDFIAWTSTCKKLATLNTDAEKITRADNYETITSSGIPSLVPRNKQLARLSKNLMVHLQDDNFKTYWEYNNMECYSYIEELYQNPYILFSQLRDSYDYEVYRYCCIKRPGLTLPQLHVIICDLTVADYEDDDFIEVLTRHELLTWDYIFMRMHFAWDYKVLSGKPNKNLIYILLNHDKDWDWELVFSDKDIHVDFLYTVLQNPEFTNRGIQHKFYKNPNLTLDFIKTNFELYWGTGIGKSKFISFEEMLQNLDINWDWKASIKNEVLEIDMVKRLIELGYLQHSDFLSRQEFAWDFIKNFNTDWSDASERFDIMKIVMESQDLEKWNWKRISKNKHITLDFIAHFHFVDWDWQELSHLEIITWEFVSVFRNKPWNAKAISRKDFVNWKMVVENPWFPWCLKTLGRNTYGKTPLSNTKRTRSDDKFAWF